jgi:4-hydroxy-2-oxoheptanedioate aldolase
MKKNISIKEKKAQSPHLLGTWSISSSPAVIESIGYSGMDFVILDMEHGDMSFETVTQSVRAAETADLSSIVRVQELNSSTILRALETGCDGIMVPHVSSKKDAEKVASSCRYSPDGDRGLSPYTRNHLYDHKDIKESTATANEKLFVGILVEGKEGMAQIDEIMSVEGIDLIYIGVYDLSQALGCTGELNHPSIEKFLKTCIKKAEKNNKMIGTFVKDIESAKTYVKLGIPFIAYVVDVFAIKEFYSSFKFSLKGE